MREYEKRYQTGKHQCLNMVNDLDVQSWSKNLGNSTKIIWNIKAKIMLHKLFLSCHTCAKKCGTKRAEKELLKNTKNMSHIQVSKLPWIRNFGIWS